MDEVLISCSLGVTFCCWIFFLFCFVKLLMPILPLLPILCVREKLDFVSLHVLVPTEFVGKLCTISSQYLANDLLGDHKKLRSARTLPYPEILRVCIRSKLIHIILSLFNKNEKKNKFFVTQE